MCVCVIHLIHTAAHVTGILTRLTDFGFILAGLWRITGVGGADGEGLIGEGLSWEGLMGAWPAGEGFAREGLVNFIVLCRLV